MTLTSNPKQGLPHGMHHCVKQKNPSWFDSLYHKARAYVVWFMNESLEMKVCQMNKRKCDVGKNNSPTPALRVGGDNKTNCKLLKDCLEYVSPIVM